MIIKIIRGIVYAIVAYFIGSVFYWTYTYNHRANTPQVSTTNTTNSTVQKSLDAGANVNNVDIERYKQNFANACIEAIPQASAQTKNYCKCMADKVVDTYGIYKVADMGLSMTQDQLETELMPLANQCIGELGVQL